VTVNRDGSFSYIPPAGLEGTDTFTYVANDGFDDSNTATVTISVGAITLTQVAGSETTVFGSIVSGDFTATHSVGGGTEVLEEERTSGSPRNRTSRLQHSWSFDVARGDTITLSVTASRTGNEGDDFEFAFSTDGGASFTTAFAVNSTTLTEYTAPLPADTNGTVIVRVVDTNRSGGLDILDRLTVDAIIITTDNPLPALPEVTVSASDASAAETGDPATFTFTRDVTDTAITVGYQIAGTATNGTDYEFIDGVVVFAEGVASVTVEITPIDDALAEGDELVEIMLDDGAGYTVGIADTAFVTIADDDFSAGQFRATSESTGFGTVTSGDYTATYFVDSDAEAITEELYAGRNKTRLQHTWTISGVSGVEGTLTIGATTSGETFAFSYSLDGGLTWIPITSAPFALNGATTVLVQVTDTDSSKGDTIRDTVTVDHVLLTTTN
jgi:hypothetical protein